MVKFPIRLGVVVIATFAILYGCGDNTGSVTGPDPIQSIRARAQTGCGEDTYLSLLSPVLVAWQDSIGAAFNDSLTLSDTPPWTETSVVSTHLAQLAPALQQWHGVIDDALVTATLDTIPEYVAGSTHHQDYLAQLSGVLTSWKATLETAFARGFLTAPPVFVRDTTAPELVCPGDTTFACADTSGVALTFEVTAIDDCDPLPVVTCEPPSGSVFKPGATLVTCTAADSSGNTSTCTFTVTVDADTEPPVIVAASASPNVLWPPNHKWVDVQLVLDSEDECDEEPVCEILHVTSNEPVNGTGDGNTQPDWMIGAGGGLKLRAERAGGGSGRIYTVHYRCTDSSGNSTDGTVEVSVPHDRGGGHGAGK